MILIVPNYVSSAINKAIDEQLALHPNAAPDREIFYDTLLSHFNDHGVIPDFSLERNEQPR